VDAGRTDVSVDPALGDTFKRPADVPHGDGDSDSDRDVARLHLGWLPSRSNGDNVGTTLTPADGPGSRPRLQLLPRRRPQRQPMHLGSRTRPANTARLLYSCLTLQNTCVLNTV